MDVYTQPISVNQPDRRKHIKLRDIFHDVVGLVEPYFQPAAGLNGLSTDFWAAKAIRDAYSDLTNEEVQTLTAAAGRYCREQGGGKETV